MQSVEAGDLFETNIIPSLHVVSYQYFFTPAAPAVSIFIPASLISSKSSRHDAVSPSSRPLTLYHALHSWLHFVFGS
jgi:hypothetical protein